MARIIFDTNCNDDTVVISTNKVDGKIMFAVTPSRKGYKFLGLAKAPDVKEPEWTGFDISAVEGEQTLYAIWQKMTENEIEREEYEDDIFEWHRRRILGRFEFIDSLWK